jgi:hypothetical protein
MVVRMMTGTSCPLHLIRSLADLAFPSPGTLAAMPTPKTTLRTSARTIRVPPRSSSLPLLRSTSRPGLCPSTSQRFMSRRASLSRSDNSPRHLWASSPRCTPSPRSATVRSRLPQSLDLYQNRRDRPPRLHQSMHLHPRVSSLYPCRSRRDRPPRPHLHLRLMPLLLRPGRQFPDLRLHPGPPLPPNPRHLRRSALPGRSHLPLARRCAASPRKSVSTATSTQSCAT